MLSLTIQNDDWRLGILNLETRYLVSTGIKYWLETRSLVIILYSKRSLVSRPPQDKILLTPKYWRKHSQCSFKTVESLCWRKWKLVYLHLSIISSQMVSKILKYFYLQFAHTLSGFLKQILCIRNSHLEAWNCPQTFKNVWDLEEEMTPEKVQCSWLWRW